MPNHEFDGINAACRALDEKCQLAETRARLNFIALSELSRAIGELAPDNAPLREKSKEILDIWERDNA